jgi:hypothetical protein
MSSLSRCVSACAYITSLQCGMTLSLVCFIPNPGTSEGRVLVTLVLIGVKCFDKSMLSVFARFSHECTSI